MKVNVERGRLPPELTGFFSREGRSLIVRGAPGTGKTTLAMEILDRFRESGDAIFVSARVDEQALKNHLRWVDPGMLLSRGVGAGSKQRRKGVLNRSELDRLESRVEEGDETLEGDYDPEPGAGSMEGDAWTIDIAALLPEIDSLYEKLGTGMPGRAMVAIDSIDSLAEKYGIAPRRLIHTLQKDLVERSGVSVIFILETAEGTGLDFMGDGVISLEADHIGGRRLRMMKLGKLRGECIWHPEVAFSLAGGRFDSFPVREPVPGQESGAQGVNIGLGGLLENVAAPGRYALFEFHGSVPPDIVGGIVRSIVTDALMNGMAAYTTPSLRLFGPGPGIQDPRDAGNFKVISPMHLATMDSEGPGTVLVDGNSFTEDFDCGAVGRLFPETRPLLFLMDANQILSHYGTGAMAGVENHISQLVRGGGACIGFSWPDSNPMDMDLGMSGLRFRVESRGPSVLMYGIKPHTPVHVLAPCPDKGGMLVPKPIL